MTPDIIGHYEIKGILGEGGMATVYRAYDPRFEREVALKMLHDHSLRDKDTRARFLREGRIIARLDHPHIVPVYDIGEAAEKPYLVMRLMSGGSLRDQIKQGPMPLAHVTDVFKDISGALDEAHEQGVIHRDLKPSNILLDQRGDVFLSDFGIVKNLEAKNKLTSTGMLIGTMAYMSPEQFQSKPIDGRSDIYALGVVLYEMLTGQLPFDDDSFFDLMQAHMQESVQFTEERWAELPAMCQVVITKAMAKKPADRYTNAHDMYQDLQLALANSEVGSEAAPPFKPPIPTSATTTATKQQHLTTTERIQMQLKRLPAGVRWGIVAVGLVLLFSFLYQALAAPKSSPQPATVTAAVVLRATNTAIPPSETPPPPTNLPTATAVTDSILVRDWDNSAVWQVGDSVSRIPEDGKLPLGEGVMLIQSNASPLELLLPDRSRLVLDSNTSLSLHHSENDQETAVTLTQGRLGIEPVGLPIQVESPTGAAARISSGLIGITYNPELQTFDVDCLEGVCQLHMPGQDPVSLNGGEKRQATQTDVLAATSAEFEPFLQLFNRLPTTTPLPTTTATATATITTTPTWTPIPTNQPGERIYRFDIGESVTGQKLEMVQFGDGPRKIILVGGTHAGYAPNTVNLAKEFIDYYTENETAVPEDVTLFIIPNLNPDAPTAISELPGRLNANGVDLNRNWDCRWTDTPIVLGNREPGLGGTAVESEPEVQALANFIRQQSPTAVIQLAAHGRNYGTASPGSCIERTLVSVSLAKLYGNAAEYLFPDTDNDGLVEPDARLTGDMTNWLDSINIPAISILLPRYQNTEFELNLAGLTAVLEEFKGPETAVDLQDATETESCPETTVINEGVYQQHQDKLGCAQGSIKRPSGAVQSFENGRMIWRSDTDAVYLLYNSGSLATYIVKEAEAYEETDLLKGAFGYLWQTKPNVSSRMGPPKGSEHVANNLVLQDFENGTILKYDGVSNLQILFTKTNGWEE